jgi:hypothetical protein
MSERILRSLYIHPDQSKVEIKFTEIRQIEDETEEDGSRSIKINHTVEAPLRPTKGLLDDFKSFRRHGLEIAGIELADEPRQIKKWGCQRITIAGDYVTKKSRIVITLSLACELTGKVIPVKVGQVTMYPKADDKVKYHKADELTKLFEKVVEKVWNYLNGDMEEDGQFVIFARLHPEAVTV